MFRIVTLLLVFLAAPHTAACEKPINPTTDCWNPSNKHVSAELQRFYVVSKEIDEALFVNDLGVVEALANEYLQLAEKFKKNWNYGNAIHGANIALGIVEVRKGNIENAGEFLVAAGKSNGSPQLDSFGPDLTLANVLLKKGQNEAVVHYLNGVQRFWEMDQGRLAQWIEAISRGNRPELSRYPI